MIRHFLQHGFVSCRCFDVGSVLSRRAGGMAGGGRPLRWGSSRPRCRSCSKIQFGSQQCGVDGTSANSQGLRPDSPNYSEGNWGCTHLGDPGEIALSDDRSNSPVIELHMAHFRLGSFLIGLVSNWAQF